MHVQRSFSFTLRRPSESLGMAMPASRRINPASVHRTLALSILFVLFAGSVGMYISMIGRTAQRTVERQTLERQVERSEEIVADLDQKIAREQAMPAIQARVQQLGFVPIDRSEYVPVTLPSTVARD